MRIQRWPVAKMGDRTHSNQYHSNFFFAFVLVLVLYSYKYDRTVGWNIINASNTRYSRQLSNRIVRTTSTAAAHDSSNRPNCPARNHTPRPTDGRLLQLPAGTENPRRGRTVLHHSPQYSPPAKQYYTARGGTPPTCPVR
jgi:hypothetical protein